MTDTKQLLSCDAVTSLPLTIDWSDTLGEDMEGWRAFEAIECDECDRTVVVSSLGQDEHRYIEPEIYDEVEDEDLDNECTGNICFEGPQMNYFYPVRIDDCEDAALMIADLPLCVIELEDGTTGLALTGGGQDLSWEICRAFIALGYLPPLHFCDLPSMAGLVLDEQNQAVIDACKRSAEIAARWAEGATRRLWDLEDSMKKNVA